MDKDRIKGAFQKLKGSVGKSVTKMTGSERLEAEGRIDKVSGQVRTVVGEAKDTARNAAKPLAK